MATVLASEAQYHDNQRCVEMPCCGFLFEVGHIDDNIEPAQYTCPLCPPPKPEEPDLIRGIPRGDRGATGYAVPPEELSGGFGGIS